MWRQVKSGPSTRVDYLENKFTERNQLDDKIALWLGGEFLALQLYNSYLKYQCMDYFREQQCKMAKYMEEIFGDLLLKDFLKEHPRKKGK